MLRADRDAVEVDVNDLLEPVHLQLVHGIFVDDAGIVGQNIQLAVFFRNGSEDLLDICFVRHVHDHSVDAVIEVLARVFLLFSKGNIRRDNRCARVIQRVCNAHAVALRRAGDDRHMACQIKKFPEAFQIFHFMHLSLWFKNSCHSIPRTGLLHI